jgi:hypothetical protein
VADLPVAIVDRGAARGGWRAGSDVDHLAIDVDGRDGDRGRRCAEPAGAGTPRGVGLEPPSARGALDSVPFVATTAITTRCSRRCRTDRRFRRRDGRSRRDRRLLARPDVDFRNIKQRCGPTTPVMPARWRWPGSGRPHDAAVQYGRHRREPDEFEGGSWTWAESEAWAEEFRISAGVARRWRFRWVAGSSSWCTPGATSGRSCAEPSRCGLTSQAIRSLSGTVGNAVLERLPVLPPRRSRALRRVPRRRCVAATLAPGLERRPRKPGRVPRRDG